MMDMLVSGINALANTMDKSGFGNDTMAMDMLGLGFEDSVVLVNANVIWRERGRDPGGGEGERHKQTQSQTNSPTNYVSMNEVVMLSLVKQAQKIKNKHTTLASYVAM
jgi:hypothetical protein